jgi:hypothetical protein
LNFNHCSLELNAGIAPHTKRYNVAMPAQLKVLQFYVIANILLAADSVKRKWVLAHTTAYQSLKHA